MMMTCSMPPPSNCYAAPLPAQALLRAGIKEADSVLVAGLRYLNPADADAFVMTSVLQVQEAARAAGRSQAPHFVARVRTGATSSAITDFLASVKRVGAMLFSAVRHQRYFLTRPVCLSSQAGSSSMNLSTPDLIQPDQLLASILAQSASDPDYLKCIHYLLTSSEGAEVYLRDPSLFGIPSGKHIFMTLRLPHLIPTESTVIFFF